MLTFQKNALKTKTYHSECNLSPSKPLKRRAAVLEGRFDVGDRARVVVEDVDAVAAVDEIAVVRVAGDLRCTHRAVRPVIDIARHVLVAVADEDHRHLRPVLAVVAEAGLLCLRRCRGKHGEEERAREQGRCTGQDGHEGLGLHGLNGHRWGSCAG